MEIPGFVVLGELGGTRTFRLYRARRSTDGAAVLLKAPARVPARPREAEGLAREWRLARAGDAAPLAQARELRTDQGFPCVVYDDGGLDPVSRLRAPATAGLGWLLALASTVSAALETLHARGVVLGGLDPAGVLSDPAASRVRFIDLSRTWQRSLDRADEPTAFEPTPYISPEQTGRINRGVDPRSDLYALGILLYELAAGRPPCESADPLELVHFHVARMPPPPPGVPSVVGRIVLRLLAKDPEDRYQTASGVRHDLETCAARWREQGAVDDFDLGSRDVPARLVVPRKLYGRAREVAALGSAFEGACAGRPAVVLVGGYAGVGKTTLIGELYRPIVRQRGYFAAGKVDQVVRATPYGPIAEAFGHLAGQFLTESEGSLAAWRDRLLGALGANAGVLTPLVPDIEAIIGRPPPPAPLDVAEAQNRFRYVLQRFVGAVATADHPLVVFLDDLQWADTATLDLLEALLTSPDGRHLLLVGAYRDNEVDESHPLMAAADRLRRSAVPVAQLTLAPLAEGELAAWLGDALRREGAEIDALAGLVLAKTGGNPFFVVQFLETLVHEGVLRFEPGVGRWTFALEAVDRAATTGNVVDLLAQRIGRLSPGAQQTLRLAACIGSRFDWGTLLTVGEQAPDELATGLAEALGAGLIERAPTPPDAPRGPGRAAYAFVHDRVQQAAYASIDAARQGPVHLQVGRLLLSACDGQPPGDRVFEIATHFNLARPLIGEAAERRVVARLDLEAGRRAKATAAYQAAADYLEHGLALAGDDWGGGDDLALALHLEAAEAAYLCARFDRAERLVARLLRAATTPADLAQVHALRIRLYEHQSRWEDALASGRDGLRLFGVSLPATPDLQQAALEDELRLIDELRGDRPIASLVALPPMEDAGARLVLRLLTVLWAPAYLSGNEVLTRLVSAAMVRLSLAHGQAADSAYGYVTHAITIGPVRHDYRSAVEWGELALAVDERFGDPRYRAKIYQQFQAHVSPWRRPLAQCVPLAREASRSGLESGDFTYAGYGLATEAWAALLSAGDLERFVADYTPTLARLEALRMDDFVASHRVLLQWALALQGRTAGPLVLGEDAAAEAALVDDVEARAPFFRTFVRVARLHLALVFDEPAVAVAAWRAARQVAPAGTIWPVFADAWGAIACCALPGALDGPDAPDVLAAHRSLGVLAENCPENFRGWWLLLSAAIAAARAQPDEALSCCREAVRHARETGSLQVEALAFEAAARVRQRQGPAAEVAGFVREARRCHAAWGAHARARHLDARYAVLAETPPPRHVRGEGLAEDAPPDGAASLDMATVLKLAQAVAVETDLTGLVRTLLTIAMENAGAQRCAFLVERDEGASLEAEATADPGQVVVGPPQPLDASDRVPRSIVQLVRRTGRDVLVANAAEDERFRDDPYVLRTRSRSVLCVAVGHQGRLGGVLCLENALTAGAFTPARAELMRIVAAQAAISLDNARLYDRMRQEVARRTAAERALREAMAELEAFKNRLQAENVYLQEEIRTQHNFTEVVGNSPRLREALHRIEQVAPTASTVLITGETGTGKEIVARAIHSRSARRDRPLVKVNCGAIPAGLVESELFGHVKGAFTGALQRRTGRFELAHGGSIFLDEVGELPAETQVKLLRVLQEQEFEPVGATQSIRVDVRVIAATNRDLEAMVRAGTFRADLYYRLNVFPIAVPPLRERPEDVPLLVAFFLTAQAKKLGKPLTGVTAASLDRLRRYAWPGNVRELQNLVERAAILATGPIVDFRPGPPDATPAEPAEPDGEAAAADQPLSLVDLERRHILQVVTRAGWIIEGSRGAAAVLGLHPNTLRSRMKKLGIVRPRHDMS